MRGNFTVNENAIVLFQMNFSSTAPLIRFNTSSAKLIVCKKLKSMIFYTTNLGYVFILTAQRQLILQRKIDYWQTSPTLSESGEITENHYMLGTN